MLLVIDTARYQLGLDLNLPWAAGYRTNYVKAGGDNSGRYVATGYHTIVDRSRAIGYRIGHYWVPSAAMDPVGAADFFVDNLRGWTARDFLVLDNESLDGARRYGDAAAAAFINRCKSRLSIPGKQVKTYSGWYDANGTQWPQVLATGTQFIIADYRSSSQPGFNFPNLATIPRSRIDGHQTGGIVWGGVATDVNTFLDSAFDYAGTAGGGARPIVGATSKMRLAWDTGGTGWLVTEDGWHGLPSRQVYELFKRLINSNQAADFPDRFLRAEVDIMNSHLRLLRTANRVDVQIDPLKYAAALRDELAKSGIAVTIEGLQDAEFQVKPEVLRAAIEAAAPRVAKVIVQQSGQAITEVLLGGDPG